MKNQRIVSILALGAMLALISVNSVIAQGQGQVVPDVDHGTITGNQHQASLAGNATHQFRFQHQFEFRLQINNSVELDLECEEEQIGDRNFMLQLNTSEAVNLAIQLQAQNENYGLTEGNQVQHQEQERVRYRYQENFAANISINATGPIQARLCIETQDQNATWAYWDETEEEFVPVDSEYEDGMLVADTDHFSYWTVLTIDNETSIPGYTILAPFALIGIVMVIRKMRK